MKYINPEIQSSFRENDLGKTLYDLVIQLKPKKIIEFGALNGYSTVCMAMALDELGKGKIESYDLWKKYPHKNARMSDAQFNVGFYGLNKYVDFFYADVFDWKPEPADMFFIDISNDGDKLLELKNKLMPYGPVFFEGGSYERDNVYWMSEYNRTPITGSIDYEVIDERFPSISKML